MRGNSGFTALIIFAHGIYITLSYCSALVARKETQDVKLMEECYIKTANCLC